ncbi:echinoderm microtubule-associated protein-like 6 [Hippocampus zosterae]|uniref:echinoderm microtubule-associated protein-like 6 n=1 Tax=Hippocampus zosterae TaxID=109293 RepID=UPI00223D464B|nr:echinoderm microtubule-associated protein-like 6 [Hippocampus zosterae]
MAFSHDRKLVATGEVGPKPFLHIWDVESLEPVFSSKFVLEKGICCCAFSPDNELVACAAINDDHNVAVVSFVTVGIKHYCHWKIEGKKLTKTKGKVSRNNCLLVSVIADGDRVLTGSGENYLTEWRGTSNPILDEDSVCLSIRSIDCLVDGTFLVGTLGSEIYEVTLWKEGKFSPGKTGVDSFKKINCGHYAPNQKWLNEVWGLVVHPDGEHILSCGDDATLRVLHIASRTAKAIISLNFGVKAINVRPRVYMNADRREGYMLAPDPATKDLVGSAKGRCLCVSEKSHLVGVGCLDGTIRLFNQDYVPQFIIKHAKKEISDIKFSPDEDHLIVASHDSHIYVYNYNGETFAPTYRPIKKHTSAVLHFDFSKDGSFIHSTCRSYELLFFEINLGKQMTSGATSLRNELWHTWTVPLGWPVQGIWPDFSDGTDINAVDRSHETVDGSEVNYRLLATGDDFGMVKIFKYPSLHKNSVYVKGTGHSSHVTNVRFGLADERLFSAGGEDQCILQWRVIKHL